MGAQQAAFQHGYNLMLLGVEPGKEWRETATAALGSGQIDVLILQVEPYSTADDLRAFDGRVVLLTSAVDAVPSVVNDTLGGVREAMRNLFELGHRRIAYLVPPAHGGRRVRVYREALTAAGIAPDPQAGWPLAESAQVARGLLQLSTPPTAILCADDLLAAGV